METVARIDKSEIISNVVRQDGMLRVPARLTRVGVFTYHKPDGSVWKEFRPDTEVFKADSLATYSGRPLTVGHQVQAVDANSWGVVAVGDVRDDAHRDGDFVVATVQISDAPTVTKVDSKDLIELSCGYKCQLELTPGQYNGEHYDAIQRNIQLNHVALLPANRGRAGNDVRLLLDENQDLYVEKASDSLLVKMADLDDLTKAKQERVDALDEIARLKRELETAKGEALANKSIAEQARNDAKQVASGLDAKVAARVALLDQAKKVYPEIRVDGKSDFDIRKEVILKLQPSTRLDGLTEDFVNGLYHALVSNYDGGRKAVESQIANLNKPVADVVTKTDSDENPIEAAYKRMRSRNANMYRLSDNQIFDGANRATDKQARKLLNGAN